MATATSDIVIEVDGGAPGAPGGWLDIITDLNFPGGNVLVLDCVNSSVAPDGSGDPTGPQPAPPKPTITGAPFGPMVFLVPKFSLPTGLTTPTIADPMTSGMISAYQAWGIPNTFVAGFANVIVIPLSKLASGVNTKIKLSMAVPGYGSDFNVTKKQTTYVPWDLKLGVTFPGGDTDQFGNVWPIRAHGLNANGNGTLIVPGSPGALPFLFDAGWGCWTTLAQSNQQCAALNTWFGSSVNYVSFAWDFWFTAYCGSTGAINGWIFKGKDAESGKWNGPPGLPFDKALSSISLFYGTGHGPRTSSWGFVDTGTAHLGASGTVAIIVDTVAKTLKAG